MKTLVLLGTARDDSFTLKAIERLCPDPDYELVDLRSHNIGYYQYDHSANQADDFKPIIDKMSAAELIVFATPVYWYSMSGVMKVFFDRLSELLSTYKPIGKGLKGKTTLLIATGASPELPPGFEIPFKMTSEYFGMTYQKALYASTRA